MLRYLTRRLLLSILVILGVTLIAFICIEFVPGDVVDFMLGDKGDLNPEASAALRHELGLDRPAYVRYLVWLGNILQGDLGNSLRSKEPINGLMRQRLPVTIELAFLANLVAVLIGIPAGVVAAIRQYKISDRVSSFIALLGISTPSFWLATMLIMVFSLALKLMPPGGELPAFTDDPWGNLKRMAMPALSLGLPAAAVYFRMTRSSMLEVVHSDYIRTAISKGLSEKQTILWHALKNALIPVVTMSSLEITHLLGGSFIIESIFSLPGMGRATLDSIFKRDYMQLQGSMLAYSIIVVLISVILDVSYAMIDPRIRFD